MRRWVLGVVLVALVAALAYDYGIVRRKVEVAYDRIGERAEEANASPRGSLSSEEVRSILGKQPSRSFNDGSARVEVFSWISGLPFRTHDLYVVYETVDDTPRYVRHSKFGYDSTRDVIGTDDGAGAERETESSPNSPTAVPTAGNGG